MVYENMAEGSVTNVEEQAWILNKIICYFVIHPWIPVVSPDPSGLATGTWLQYWGLWEIWALTCCCLGLKCRACSLLQPRVGWQLSAIIVSTGACSCWVPGLLSTKHKAKWPSPFLVELRNIQRSKYRSMHTLMYSEDSCEGQVWCAR